MAFQLKQREAVTTELLRLADRQLRLAERQLQMLEPDREKAVHQARRRCKRVRAVLRLLRKSLGEQRYRDINGQVRDAAGNLSGARDADVLLATARTLAADDAAWVSVTEELARRRRERHGPEAEQPDRAVQSAEDLRQARQQLQSPRLKGGGRKRLRKTLQRDYRRARRRLPEPDPGLEGEAWHDWRKAVKTHGLQLDVVRLALPGTMADRRRRVKRLGKLLGDEHDLQVLAVTLAAAPQAFGKKADVQHCQRELAALRERQQSEARELGMALFAEKPGRFIRRLKLGKF
ncbi:MAG: CHAD domain-containing protein [Ectothiorhodospiraceae bacterium]|nr:CHAD domain-containing protein [Ectothiorhodospiraceae bacterium]MCH8505089.1 CHAD domain-containing protein [Ectothiorhodospiraceae bacterium]